jgi:hypothetical protein
MKRVNRPLIVAFTLCSLGLLTADGGSAYFDPPKLLNHADKRFQDTLNEHQMQHFYDSRKQQMQAYYESRKPQSGGGGTTREQKIAASELVYNLAVASDTRSAVDISASKGVGAKIKYQTLGQRMRHEMPTTAKGLTASTERMYIGRYHIWSEREDQVTSDPDAEFEIVAKVEKVTLEEIKAPK